MRPSSVEAFFFFVLLILVCPDGAYPLWVKPFFLLGRDFVCLVCWLRLAQPEPQPSRWRPAVSWRLCRLETARALWVLCRLMGGCLVGEPIFLLWGSGVFLPCSCFFACPAGAKTAFSFQGKENSGSGLRKRKGRPVEIMGRYDTTGRWCCAVMVSLG